jgi:predicted hotdog family 3-hydroxylacyl-ACP dehydratase
VSSPPADPATAAAAFPPLIDLVPHKPPMLLLDRVLSYSNDVVSCEVQIRPDSMFVEDGQVAAVVGLEYMAQAVAAFAGLTARIEKKEFRLGLLLGSRELRFATDAFLIGDRLVVEARRTWGENELGHFICKIERGGELLASGTLAVYQGQMPDRAGGGRDVAAAGPAEPAEKHR